MQTSRRSILKGSLFASMAASMGAVSMAASAEEKRLLCRKKNMTSLFVVWASAVSSQQSARQKTD